MNPAASDPTVVTYVVYLVLSIALTIWVARTLHSNGRLFLVDVFQGNEPLADSTNHLLIVGFYLVNLGYVSLALRISGTIADTRGSIEALSWKVGLVLVVLGAMHFFNLYVFSRIRRRARLATSGPPLPPDEWLGAPPRNPPPLPPSGLMPGELAR